MALAAVLAFTASARLAPAGPDFTSPAETEAVLAASATPRAEAPASDSALAKAVRVGRSADGMFYVHMAVNGQPIRFLLDTGANTVLLTSADARRVGVGVDDPDFTTRLATAGGKAAMSWATLDHVAVAGHDLRDVRAAVVRDGLPVSLLGQDMLARLTSMTIAGDQLTLR